MKNLFDSSFQELLDVKKLSEEYIREHADKVDWYVLSRFCSINSLSHQTIKDYMDFWRWDIISRYQPMTVEFMKEFIDYIDFDVIGLNDKINIDELIELVNEKEKAKK